MKKMDKVLTILVLAACLAGVIFSFLSRRALVGETSTWFLYVIEKRGFYFDFQFFRLTDRILQIPAILILKLDLFKSQFLALNFLQLSYLLHPILSLLFCYRITKFYKREDLIIFPLLSYAIATIPAQFQVIVMAPLALSIFWPLFLLAALMKHDNLQNLSGMMITFCLLIFTYEPVVLLLPIFSIAGVLNERFGNADRKTLNRFLIFAPFPAMAWIVYFLLEAPIGYAKSSFMQSLFQSLDPYRFAGVVVILLLSIALVADYLLNPRLKFILIVIPVAIVFILSIGLIKYLPNDVSQVGISNSFNIYNMNFARTTAIPFSFVLALLFLFYYYARGGKTWFDSTPLAWLYRVSCFTVILGCLIDMSLTSQVKNDFQTFRRVVGYSSGCRVVRMKDFSVTGWFPVPMYAVHANDIVTRILDGQYPVEGFVIAREDDDSENNCPKTENEVVKLPAGNSIKLREGIAYTDQLLNSFSYH